MDGLLLCDDLIFTSRIVGAAQAHGLTLRTAKTVAELGRLLQQAPPRCVILDLQLAGLDTNELAHTAIALTPRPFLVGYGSHVDTATLTRAQTPASMSFGRAANSSRSWQRRCPNGSAGGRNPHETHGGNRVLHPGAASRQRSALRRSYEPPPFESAPLDLRGTIWVGADPVCGVWHLIFAFDGSITYRYNNTVYKNGTWTLKGNDVYFEMNNRYCENLCNIKGNIIQGESWNIRGARWPTRLERTLSFPAP